MKMLIPLCTFALLLSLTPLGCSEVERTHDCIKICDNYATCLDSDLDKSDCVDSCEDRGEADESFAKKASKCEECLNDKDCASSTASCFDTCAEVIARSALGQGGAQD